MGSLFIGFFAGVVGVAYFVYGKRQTNFTAMLAGILLCVYPYFVDSPVWLAVIGIALMGAPFVIRY